MIILSCTGRVIYITPLLGVSVIEDIINLLPLEPVGVKGVITGKALYSGTLDLKRAIELTRSNRTEPNGSH